MSTSMGIFIKTCRKDIEWLSYCLKSILKFGAGFSEIVILADSNCRGVIGSVIPENLSVKIVYCQTPSRGFGYFHQEACKLMADAYVQSDVIMFVDSDCVFFKPFSPEMFIREGKPILIRTRYDFLAKSPDGKAALCWKAPTEQIVGCNLEWEYMRRIPLVFRREIYAGIRERYPHIQRHVRSLPGFSGFSEFNLMGAYIELYAPESHFITDSEVWEPERVVKQFWSWGGLKPEIRNEIEEILN